jgi:hypothetical protein
MKRFFRSKVGIAIALFADLLISAGPSGPYEYSTVSFETARALQARMTDDWLSLDGVVGVAIGSDGSGNAVVKVLLAAPGVVELPRFLDGVQIVPEVTGPFLTLVEAPAASVDADMEAGPSRTFPRPVPIGVSTGHPAVTAGTIGARVHDGQRVFALSNNHVFAARNDAKQGDPLLQPGRVDGGRNPEDAIATLFDFEPIRFCGRLVCEMNRMDAAIALSTREQLGSSTPEEGYGSPRPWSVEAKIGATVQKYGRTTGQTVGTITGIHATVDVGYGAQRARFEDQIVISGRGFSAGGDSGSLVVTRGALLGDRRPVGLLFAGSASTTLANPIDVVLDRFSVTIDGS